MKVLRGLTVTVLAGLLIGIGWMLTNTQQVIDWWRLRDYQPPAAIQTLAAEASLNDTGTKLFYVHYPELLDKQGFAGKCSVDEVTIVLGCYLTHSKIYIFDVTESKLEGIEQVTAAHEVLHAAYDRLSSDEKSRINALLEDVYAQQTNERFLETIENYRERDESVVPNELHSIVGTEIRDLPDELETYYARYFTDRQQLVSLAEQYAAAFQELKDQIAAYDDQLADLQASIDAKETDLEQLAAALQQELAQLEALRGDPSAYNAAVPGYNEKVRSYNSRLTELRATIDRYNQLVAERNMIAVQESELVEAIDTRFEQVPQ